MYLRDKLDYLLNNRSIFGLRHIAAYYRNFFYKKEYVVEKKMRGGGVEKGLNKGFYVIRVRHNDAGAIAYARYVVYKLVEAEEKGLIPVVDMRDGTNAYLDKKALGKVNIWECYFKQPAIYGLDDIKDAEKVVYSCLDIKETAEPYNDKIKELARKYISFSDTIDNRAEEFIKRWKGKYIVGLKFRGSDYLKEKAHLHAKQPTLDEMVEFIETALKRNGCNPDYLFLATEDKLIIDTLQKHFGEKIILNDIQRIDHDESWLKSEYFLSDKIKMGEEYCLDVAILGKCNSLICSGSQGSWLAVSLNEQRYDFVERIDLGVY